MIHGHATIGKLSGNLLTGMTVHDFSITDSAGKPFVAVRVVQRRTTRLCRCSGSTSGSRTRSLVRPLIVLDRPPDGTWNWQRIFPRDTTPKPAAQQPSWGDWLRFTNAKVVGGQLIVRTPWKPSAATKRRRRATARFAKRWAAARR